jgi:hypothetical protein
MVNLEENLDQTSHRLTDIRLLEIGKHAQDDFANGKRQSVGLLLHENRSSTAAITSKTLRSADRRGIPTLWRFTPVRKSMSII